MSEWMGREYNYDIWSPSHAELRYLRCEVTHAGDRAPDFTLPLLDGGELSLSSLRGKPTMIEFGSIS
jgi:hypothetical protein